MSIINRTRVINVSLVARVLLFTFGSGLSWACADLKQFAGVTPTAGEQQTAARRELDSCVEHARCDTLIAKYQRPFPARAWALSHLQCQERRCYQDNEFHLIRLGVEGSAVVDRINDGSISDPEDPKVLAAVQSMLSANTLPSYYDDAQAEAIIERLYAATRATIVAVLRSNSIEAEQELQATKAAEEQLRGLMAAHENELAQAQVDRRAALEEQHNAGRQGALERQAQRRSEIVALRLACSPTEPVSNDGNEDMRAANCVAYGKRLEYPYSPAPEEIEDQARAFKLACELGDQTGCYEHVQASHLDGSRAIALLQKACKSGIADACADDLHCVERKEVAVAGHRVSRDSMRVTGSVSVDSIASCLNLCARGLPGACLTAGRYHSSVGNDAKANVEFNRACALGNKPSCP